MARCVSALKFYATSMYCSNLADQLTTILWKIELRSTTLKETSCFNHVSISTRSKIKSKIATFVVAVVTLVVFLRQLWLVLQQLWLIATILNIATIVITSAPTIYFDFLLQYFCLCHLKATLTFFQQNTPCFGFHYVFRTLHNFILMVFELIKQGGKSSDGSPWA